MLGLNVAILVKGVAAFQCPTINLFTHEGIL